jgi:NADH-quinone oxidoreductase subunit G
MATVTIDGQELEIGESERLNGIQAAARVGVEIPHYCWHPGLSVVASCRMCLVEAGRRDPQTGDVSMIPKLVPACQTPATDGTVFVTDSEKVDEARAMVEEDLLIRHPIDCPVCDKAGECYLQDYHFKHGRDQRRADLKPFTSRRRPLGETVTLFVDRCVMCSRCVRFCREVSDTKELMVINRGAHEEIDVFPGFPLDNKMSGNVVDLCPVGALGDRDFLYSQRVWFLKSRPQVCAGCSTGCSIMVEENQDRVYRIKPRENPAINQWWMCDEGRYGWKHVHDEKRLTELRIRDQRMQDGGAYGNLEWKELPTELTRLLSRGGRLAGVISPHLTVEEAYLFARYLRSLDPQAVLGVGPIPIAGEDTMFPGGFTIRAEKCPNRRGVEEIVSQLGDELLSWDTFLQRVEDDPPRSVWLTGGYKTDWNDAETVAKLAGVDHLIVQDCFSSPLMQQATIQIPSAAFAEREGSYVNSADRLQSFRWSIRPPAGVMTEAQLFWRLLERPGLYRGDEVLREVANELHFFVAATEGVPEYGLDLKFNQLAELM